MHAAWNRPLVANSIWSPLLSKGSKPITVIDGVSLGSLTPICRSWGKRHRRQKMKIGEMTLEDAAKAASGNWQKFDCFAWHRQNEIKDPDNWGIFYTKHRDSGLLDQSNAVFIEAALEPFTEGNDPNVVMENHDHWAVGKIYGFSIRVRRRGKITRAFRKYHELAQRLADYPILDESDYFSREYEATLENIPNAAWKLKNEYELPEHWSKAVYDWFAENDCDAIENSDDQGGYPTEEQLRAAFDALGYKELELV
jgi:hypothetical protein